MTKIHLPIAIVGLSILLTACGGSSNSPAPTPSPSPPPAMASFEVTVQNLSNSQPFSPLGLVAHGDDYQLFQVGAAATVGFERMAEGGDLSELLTEANNNAEVRTTASGTQPIPPGGTETLSFDVLQSELDGLQLSLATMLVNTNDAFTAVNGLGIGAMALQETMSLNTIVYDAGTEANTEAAGSIPGPADGGEGFNPVRDDRTDHVAMHSGVISRDDGLTSSVLTQQHRFDNPAMRVSIVRTQ